MISVILKAEFLFSRPMLHSLYLSYLTAFKVMFLLVSRANIKTWLGLHTNAKVTLK